MSGFDQQRHPSLDDRFDPAIRIIEYDLTWPAQAEAELQRIGAALGEVAVNPQHVGSTAVPGLAAKPVLDLQLSVDTVESRERHIEPLERLCYLFAPAPESPGYHFFGKPPQRPRTPICTFARQGPLTSFATSPCETSCAPINLRPRATRP